MKQAWQLIDQTWIPNEYQSKQNNRMNKKGKECILVMSWLLHEKQRLVNEHGMITCVTKQVNQT